MIEDVTTVYGTDSKPFDNEKALETGIQLARRIATN